MSTKSSSLSRTFTFANPECSLKAFGKKRSFSLENGKVKALDPHTASIIFFNSILSFLESMLAKLAKKEESREHFRQHPFQWFVMETELTAKLGEKTYQYRCYKRRTFATNEEFTIVRVASDDINVLATQRGIDMGTPSFTQNVVDMYDLFSDDQATKEKTIKYILGYESQWSLKDWITSRFSDDNGEGGMTITKSIYKKRLHQAARVSLQERLIKLEEENQKLKDSFKNTEESNEVLKEKIRAQEETITHLQTESVMLNIQNSVMISSRGTSSYMDDLSTLKDIPY